MVCLWPRHEAADAGYSGPAVLDLSHHVVRSLDGQTPGQPPRLAVRWSSLTVEDWAAELRAPGNSGAGVGGVVRRHLPNRLAASLVAAVVDPQTPCGSLSKGEASKLTEQLAAYNLPVSGHQGCASCFQQLVPSFSRTLPEGFHGHAAFAYVHVAPMCSQEPPLSRSNAMRVGMRFWSGRDGGLLPKPGSLADSCTGPGICVCSIYSKQVCQLCEVDGTRNSVHSGRLCSWLVSFQ